MGQALRILNNFAPYTLNLSGRLLAIDRPLVMSIINATPDSFYAQSRCSDSDEICRMAKRHIDEGADIIDIGACSTRPGSQQPSASQEADRLLPAISAIRSIAPEIPISVDTYRAEVARQAIEAGANIINDVAGGNLDEAMFETVAELRVPYILTHMRGTPATMQSQTNYGPEPVTTIIAELAEKFDRLHQLGVADVIIDPGFGLAKTLEQNYRLLSHLRDICHIFETPLLVGLSRKSMITRPLDITPEQASCATSVVNTMALLQGASILRVHDTLPAVQAIKLLQLYNQSQ